MNVLRTFNLRPVSTGYWLRTWHYNCGLAPSLQQDEFHGGGLLVSLNNVCSVCLHDAVYNTSNEVEYTTLSIFQNSVYVQNHSVLLMNYVLQYCWDFIVYFKMQEQISNLSSAPEITRFSLIDAIIWCKTNPCSGSKKQKLSNDKVDLDIFLSFLSKTPNQYSSVLLQFKIWK